jgi:hypothetical protein
MFAQIDRATLTGVVQDQSHGVVPNAKVTLSAEATGLTYNGVSNNAGVYTLAGVPVGRYTASIAAPGFETLQIRPFSLEVCATRRLNGILHVGSVSSNATVMDAAPNLELTTAEVGGVIQGSQTNALPVNGRYCASLIAPIPGAINSGNQSHSRSECPFVDQLRSQSHQRRLGTVPHRLRDECGDNHQHEVQYGCLPDQFRGAGRR